VEPAAAGLPDAGRRRGPRGDAPRGGVTRAGAPASRAGTSREPSHDEVSAATGGAVRVLQHRSSGGCGSGPRGHAARRARRARRAWSRQKAEGCAQAGWSKVTVPATVTWPPAKERPCRRSRGLGRGRAGPTGASPRGCSPRPRPPPPAEPGMSPPPAAPAVSAGG
jgi:hypothetical protein